MCSWFSPAPPTPFLRSSDRRKPPLGLRATARAMLPGGNLQGSNGRYSLFSYLKVCTVEDGDRSDQACFTKSAAAFTLPK